MPPAREAQLLQGATIIITVQGKCGIYATVLKHSISPAGIQLITMEVAYPRIILAELNTHGMLCKNSSSSRAIPFEKMQQQLTGRPVRFGQANPGMQDRGEDYNALIVDPQRPHFGAILTPEEAWEQAKQDAAAWADAFYKAGYHKQVYNRRTEADQMMKTVLSWTDGANFFWLRNHDAADPSLQELARVMYEAAKQSTPQKLEPGQWHLPYVETLFSREQGIHYGIEVEEDEVFDCIDQDTHQKFKFLTLEQAISVSTARTAAVSFRNVDYGVEKSGEVFAKLTSDARIHGSAMAHQATPMAQEHNDRYHHEYSINVPYIVETWEPGVSHMDRNGQLWSAQYRGWIQHRKLIPGENKEGFILERKGSSQ